jgi:hypothetical protein
MINNEIITFLEKVEDLDKRKDCFKLLRLLEEWTSEKPKLWRNSIVGFGKYHYKYDSGREGDWFLTGFSPRKNNLSIYNTAGFSNYENIMSELGKYKTGASCLYVKRLSDINIDKLKILVEKSVTHMKEQYK